MSTDRKYQHQRQEPGHVMQIRRNPIDLSARMAVCDANYIRILKLLPDFAAAARRIFALPAVGATSCGDALQMVVLEVVEMFKYTSTVSIRLAGQPGQAYYRPPAMLVRLYHDATTAEVVSYQDQRYIRVLYPEDEAPRYYPDEKEQVNLLLADWLMLCLESGLGQPGRGQPPMPMLQASA
jgi:uncharacterized protein YqiB (DUF1249 family)